MGLAGGFVRPIQGQGLSGCPQNHPEIKGWPIATNVKYIFTSSPDGQFSDAAKNQMRAGFSAWKSENESNCMRVSFQETTVPDDASIIVRHRISGGVDTELFYEAGGLMVDQDIFINVNHPDASSPNFYKKAILHEIDILWV